MANIIFCADGTWNGPGKDDNGDGVPDFTNVLKLYSFLQGSEAPGEAGSGAEQEKLVQEDGQVVQTSKYIHGVGDCENQVEKMLGGAFGAGIIGRIVRGYTFVSRNYTGPGDNIVLVGFSRGAYTVRALAGLISTVGLLDPVAMNLRDKDSAYRAGISAWFDYRQQALAHNGWSTRLKGTFCGLLHCLTQGLSPLKYREAPIQAVAVWDTVGALGIPLSVGGEHLDVFRFADTTLSSNVEFGFHAVSLDEERGTFTPTLWDLRPAGTIQQVCFAGAHADVGGGYTVNNTESDLSDIALGWMMQQLQNTGVRFTAGSVAALDPGNPLGVAHRPWLSPAWAMLGVAPRAIPSAMVTEVHPSVAVRTGQYVHPDPCCGHVPYQPNLPQPLPS